MTVTFCGHRQMEHGAEVTAWLRNVVEDLIREGAVTFYLGGMGAFDRLEVLEYSAQAILAARDVGPLVMIDDRQVRDIEEAFHLD